VKQPDRGLSTWHETDRLIPRVVVREAGEGTRARKGGKNKFCFKSNYSALCKRGNLCKIEIDWIVRSDLQSIFYDSRCYFQPSVTALSFHWQIGMSKRPNKGKWFSLLFICLLVISRSQLAPFVERLVKSAVKRPRQIGDRSILFAAAWAETRRDKGLCTLSEWFIRISKFTHHYA